MKLTHCLNLFLHITAAFISLSCATPTKNMKLSTANGISELSKGNISFAARAFQTQCQNDERTACLELGRLLNKNGNHDKANQLFLKSCNLGNDYGCFELGRALFYSGNFSNAKPILKKSCKKNQWSCQFLGIILESEGKVNAANMIYESQCNNEYPISGCVFRGMSDEYVGLYKSANMWYKKGCKFDSVSCEFQSITETLIGQRELGFELAKKACPNSGSKICRVVTQYKALQKNPTLASKWKKECSEKKPSSCYQLGLLQSQNLKTIELSRITLRKACDLGDGFGCLELANFLSRYKHHKEYAKLMEEACNKGAGSACTTFSDKQFPYQVPEPNKDYYTEGCHKGHGRSCLELANRSLDKENKKKYFQKACDLKYYDGCYHRTKLETENGDSNTLKVLCDKGHIKSCTAYANNLARANKPEVALKYYQLACDGLSQWACYFFTELKVKSDPSFDRNILQQTICDNGVNYACYTVGKSHYKTGSLSKAKQYLSKGCERGGAYSCNYLGDIAFKNNNQDAAQKWYRKACDYSDARSCTHL